MKGNLLQSNNALKKKKKKKKPVCVVSQIHRINIREHKPFKNFAQASLYRLD